MHIPQSVLAGLSLNKIGSNQCCLVFTARRYAKRGVCRRHVSVRLSVCMSVTLRYCIKTAKRRITQIMPHDSPLTSFGTSKFTAKFERDHPLGWQQIKVGCIKIRHFRCKMHYNWKTVQDRRIVSSRIGNHMCSYHMAMFL